MNLFVELTRRFNEGGLRAVLSSGQAVVLHRLAIASKDGDWILRETPEDLSKVLSVLTECGAKYRFGAPLDVRWMAGGWSAHFEYRSNSMRVRTDFVTRPPRISEEDLALMWREQQGREIPFLDARRLALVKETNREKDYAVIGELARLLKDPREQFLFSRSARGLLSLAQGHEELTEELAASRPALAAIPHGVEALERALDEERRRLMHRNERRLARYLRAAEPWARVWPDLAREIAALPLPEAHRVVISRAAGILPFDVEEESR